MVVAQELGLKEENICFLEVGLSYKEVIEQLVKSLEDQIAGKCLEVVEKVLERERLVSTAVGSGIAIPHRRCDFLEDFHVPIGVVKEGGIDWEAIDGEPVQIVCLSAGPALNPTGYLSFLSHITSLLKEEEIRREILFAESKKNIVNIFLS